MTLKEMQEKREKLVAAAREALNEITKILMRAGRLSLMYATMRS